MKDPVSKKVRSREEELLGQGWNRCALASGPRLQETAELYRSLGWEVHLEPALVEDFSCPLCDPAQLPAAAQGSFVIYTRPGEAGKDAPPGEEELW